MRRIGFVVALLAIAFATRGQQPQPFQAVVAGRFSFCGFANIPDPPLIQWFEPDVTYAPWQYPFAAASADGRIVYGLFQSSSTQLQIVVARPDGTQTIVGSINNNVPRGNLTQAPNGRFFFAAAPYAPPFDYPTVIVVMSTAGVVEAIHLLNDAVHPAQIGVRIAIGPDGCTLYYANATGVGRFDACTGTPMAQFLSLNGTIRDVFPAAGGDVLVAIDRRVDWYNSGGTLLRSVSLDSYGIGPEYRASQVALNTDHSEVWFTTTRECEQETFEEDQAPPELLRISTSTGAAVTRRRIALQYPNSLIIGTAHFPYAPTASTAGLLAIAIAIAAAGLIALRR